MQPPLTVLVVDDSATYRKILSDIVQTIPEVSLVGTAPNGEEALSTLSHTPADIVLMDIDMPVMEGLETLRIIRQKHPNTQVILISGSTQGNVESVVEALETGALEFIPKPENGSPESNLQALRQQLTGLFQSTRLKRKPPTTDGGPEEARKSHNPEEGQTPQVDIIAIGISTGGPAALHELIPQLPEDLGVPILVVQHMPALFTASFAKSLNTCSKIRVKEAEGGEPVLQNTVYIAPGGKHMAVVRDKQPVSKSPLHLCIDLNDNPPENSCRPSADVLFRAIAQEYGRNILVVMMTGMGCDGTQGVTAIKQAGGYCISQSEKSCIVYGMPRSVVEKGLSDEVVDLADMARRIVALVRNT